MEITLDTSKKDKKVIQIQSNINKTIFIIVGILFLSFGSMFAYIGIFFLSTTTGNISYLTFIFPIMFFLAFVGFGTIILSAKVTLTKTPKEIIVQKTRKQLVFSKEENPVIKKIQLITGHYLPVIESKEKQATLKPFNYVRVGGWMYTESEVKDLSKELKIPIDQKIIPIIDAARYMGK